jgi:hypothetical protein
MEYCTGRNSVKHGNGSSGQFGSWKRRIQLNILSSYVASNLSNIPVLIDESILPADIWTTALNGGGDLRVCIDSQGITRISLEVVSFNTVTQKCELWINVPSLSSTTDTPIYLFYGKPGESQPAAAAAYGKYAVWPTGDYLHVAHMEGNGISSTAQQWNPQSEVNMSYSAGKIGQAADFNGVSSVIDHQADFTLNSDDIQYQFWLKPTNTAVGREYIIAPDMLSVNNFLNAEIQSGGSVKAYMPNNNPNDNTSNWTLTNSVWQWVTFIYEASIPNILFRKNYSTLDADSWTTANNVNRTNEPWGIGAYWNGAAYQGFYDGSIDELRIIDREWSNDRLSFEYKNMNDVSNVINYIFPLIPNI